LAVKEGDLEVALELCHAALARERKHHHPLALLGRVPVVLGLPTKKKKKKSEAATGVKSTLTALKGQHDG